MQLQPNTNADKDVACCCAARATGPTRTRCGRSSSGPVARFGAERLVVIAGGARGADRQAEACARELGLAVEVYPARWA
jgi:hypothetical protein